MSSTRPKPRLIARLTWHGGVLLCLAAVVLFPAVAAYAVWFAIASPDAADSPLRQTPLFAGLDLLILLVLWWMLLGKAKRGLRVWRHKDGRESAAYHEALRRIDKAGSPGGNLAAKVMLVPFVILILAVLGVMAYNVFVK